MKSYSEHGGPGARRCSDCICKPHMESCAGIWGQGLEYVYALEIFFISFNTVDIKFAVF